MSMEERTGIRSLIFSGWHRPSSIKWFLGDDQPAERLTMVDIDCCEYCYACRKPIALIETEKTDGGLPKPAPVTAELARRARIEAYSVAYSVDETGRDIRDFRVRRIEPYNECVKFMWPVDFAQFLWRLHSSHTCTSGEDRNQ